VVLSFGSAAVNNKNRFNRRNRRGQFTPRRSFTHFHFRRADSPWPKQDGGISFAPGDCQIELLQTPWIAAKELR
jgi:hypothetical protein